MFAGANFIVNLLLARWLSPSQYGAFVLSYSFFLILGIIHNSLIVEPMLVLGSADYRASIGSYYSILNKMHWQLAVLLMTLSLFVTLLIWIFGKAELASAFWGLSINAPVILLLWLSRRVFYITASPKHSAYGGIAYGIGSIVFLIVLHSWIVLTPFTAYFAVGMASLVGLGYFYLLPSAQSLPQPPVDKSQIISDHWHYGHWILPSALIGWIPGNALYFLLSAWGNLQNGAAFRSAMNLQMPVLHLFTALGILLIPYFSNLVHSGNLTELRRKLWIAIAIFGIIALLYCMLLLLANKKLFGIFYAGKFMQVAHLVPVLSIFLFFASFTAVLGTILRCLRATRAIFIVAISSAVVSLTAGFLLIPRLGVRGAVFTMIISSTCEAAVMSLMLMYTWREMKR